MPVPNVTKVSSLTVEEPPVALGVSATAVTLTVKLAELVAVLPPMASVDGHAQRHGVGAMRVGRWREDRLAASCAAVKLQMPPPRFVAGRKRCTGRHTRDPIGQRFRTVGIGPCTAKAADGDGRVLIGGHGRSGDRHGRGIPTALTVTLWTASVKAVTPPVSMVVTRTDRLKSASEFAGAVIRQVSSVARMSSLRSGDHVPDGPEGVTTAAPWAV